MGGRGGDHDSARPETLATEETFSVSFYDRYSSPNTRGNTLTGHDAPRLRGNHLVVNGRDAEQQDDPEQDALKVAPQPLAKDKSHGSVPSPVRGATPGGRGYRRSTPTQVILIPLNVPRRAAV